MKGILLDDEGGKSANGSMHLVQFCLQAEVVMLPQLVHPMAIGVNNEQSLGDNLCVSAILFPLRTCGCAFPSPAMLFASSSSTSVGS